MVIIPSHTFKDPSTMRHSQDNDAILRDDDDCADDDDKYIGDEEGTLSHRKLVQPDNTTPPHATLEESKDE